MLMGMSLWKKLRYRKRHALSVAFPLLAPVPAEKKSSQSLRRTPGKVVLAGEAVTPFGKAGDLKCDQNLVCFH